MVFTLLTILVIGGLYIYLNRSQNRKPIEGASPSGYSSVCYWHLPHFSLMLRSSMFQDRTPPWFNCSGTANCC